MKHFLGTFCLLLVLNLVSHTAVHAQVIIQGKITDTANAGLSSAKITATFNHKKLNTLSNSDGSFQLTVPAESNVYLTVEYVGKKPYSRFLKITQTPVYLNIALEEQSLFLEPLEVAAIRATDKTPLTKINIKREEIEKLNVGQDLPFILSYTPSMVVNSDAGNGVGYTGMRIRGTDVTRINVTINGIPYNDAESQGTFFVDLPDIASSLESIQIQRGVGTSTNGSGAFGATVNLSTNEFRKTPYAETFNSYGSFNTWKNTVRLGSGLLNKHFTMDMRLSRISSNGYIDRASSNLKSFYFSTAYINPKTSLRFNIFSGEEKTYQAWNGVPQELLKTNRTYNSLGTEKPGSPYSNQIDFYRQTHYQLFFNQKIAASWALNIASFLTRGKGYYEEYKANQLFTSYGLPNVVIDNDTISETDLVRRRWLDNYFYGQTFSLQYKKNKQEFTIGGSWTHYDGKHLGDVVWAEIGVPAEYEYYRYPANKSDQNIFIKWLYHFRPAWNLFADLQYRHVTHTMNGFEEHPSLFVKRTFHFLNPKAGILYSHAGYEWYASYALAGKEPNRNDFEAAASEQPKKELLHNVEIGFSKKATKWKAALTGYAMLYKNQLVLTGKINKEGAYTRVNVPNSYRLGLEAEATYSIAKQLNIEGNITVSKNKIKNFTEYIDNYDTGIQEAVVHHNTNISFSPALTGNIILNILPLKNVEINVFGKYVSKQYLDNTQQNTRSIEGYYVQNIRIGYTLPKKWFTECSVSGFIYNVWNNKYEPNGYTFSYIYNGNLTTENYYFPMAGTNYTIAIQLKL